MCYGREAGFFSYLSSQGGNVLAVGAFEPAPLKSVLVFMRSISYLTIFHYSYGIGPNNSTPVSPPICLCRPALWLMRLFPVALPLNVHLRARRNRAFGVRSWGKNDLSIDRRVSKLALSWLQNNGKVGPFSGGGWVQSFPAVANDTVYHGVSSHGP